MSDEDDSFCGTAWSVDCVYLVRGKRGCPDYYSIPSTNFLVSLRSIQQSVGESGLN